jgi:hypothetical protein
VEERLGGNAALVEAGAAEPLARVDHDGLEPELGAAETRGVAAGSAAQHGDVHLVDQVSHHHDSSIDSICILCIYFVVEFEWDAIKRERNLRLHGVDFTEAEKTFEDRHAFVQFDGRHSKAEDRFFILGKTRTGRLLLTVFTWRGINVRIISSRRASRQETIGYEERIRLQ